MSGPSTPTSPNASNQYDTELLAPKPQRSLPHIRSSATLHVTTPQPSTTSSVTATINPSPTPTVSPKPRTVKTLETITAKPSNTIALGVVFVIAILLMFLLFRNFPDVSEADRAVLKFPRSLSEVRSVSQVLRKYRDENYEVVLAGFCAIYIFLQAFAIPGAIFLSILAGPLFGAFRGLLIVSCVATSGSSICYGISYFLGRSLVERCFPALLTRFRTQISRHRSNLFFYLLFLRISPLLPNWFISISSPILDIPYLTFAMATFFGLIPANYLHVTTGLKLEELGTSEGGEGSPVNLKALAFLFGIAFLALIPTLFKKKFEEFDAGSSATNGSKATSATMEVSPPANMIEEGHGRVSASHKNKKKVG